MKLLANFWYRSDLTASIVCRSLLPLSWLFCAISYLRRKSYSLNIKKSYAANVPLVVVGNIVAGGSGKTPLLIALCEYIKEQGFKPGVVSRGYGGAVSGVKQVENTDAAELVGDEPLMICLRTESPVVIGADRVAAVNYLLKNNQCDIVLSDDGLQHYRMRRNLEIAVVDAERGLGNGFCLPAGPLRERASRLTEVDLLVYNGLSEASCSYTLEGAEAYALNSDDSVALSSFSGKTVHVVAGIGNPSRFFSQMRSSNINVVEHAFSDHHIYRQADFSKWQNDLILMTEKDAVKCQGFQLSNAWVVPVNAIFSNVLKSKLEHELLPLLNKDRDIK